MSAAIRRPSSGAENEAHLGRAAFVYELPCMHSDGHTCTKIAHLRVVWSVGRTRGTWTFGLKERSARYSRLWQFLPTIWAVHVYVFRLTGQRQEERKEDAAKEAILHAIFALYAVVVLACSAAKACSKVLPLELAGWSNRLIHMVVIFHARNSKWKM